MHHTPLPGAHTQVLPAEPSRQTLQKHTLRHPTSHDPTIAPWPLSTISKASCHTPHGRRRPPPPPPSRGGRPAKAAGHAPQGTGASDRSAIPRLCTGAYSKRHNPRRKGLDSTRGRVPQLYPVKHSRPADYTCNDTVTSGKVWRQTARHPVRCDHQHVTTLAQVCLRVTEGRQTGRKLARSPQQPRLQTRRRPSHVRTGAGTQWRCRISPWHSMAFQPYHVRHVVFQQLRPPVPHHGVKLPQYPRRTLRLGMRPPVRHTVAGVSRMHVRAVANLW